MRLIVAASLITLALLAPAHAQTTPEEGRREQRTLTSPRSYDEVPRGRTKTARDVVAIAARAPAVRSEIARHDDEYAEAYLVTRNRWQVSWYVRRDGGRREIVQTLVDDHTGRVEEVWTGHQVAWTMARGLPGAFGRSANAPYVWIPLCLLFVLPFARRPLRMIHLDLLVLLSFSVSYAFFGAAEIGLSVPLAYPPLAYLAARMAWVAWKRPQRPPSTWMTTDVLGVAIVFLLGFRLGLNITDGNVIDVGYSGVIGADRIAQGEALYGNFPADNPHGDTYGPVNYLFYLPWELVWPWEGRWDDLPAAHAAAVTFDLMVTGALFLLGRRVADTRTGALLAYLWVTFPFSLLVLNSNANDALVGALLLGVLLVAARPAARGALAALAALTKLAPLALAPLLARGASVRYGIGFALTAIVVTIPAVLGGGLSELPSRTLGFQDERGSPFSIWGYYELDVLQEIVQWSAVALAAALYFVRAPRDVVGLAALSALVLLALQLAVTHWFYLYLAWVVPPILVALLVPRQASARSTGSIDSARPGPEERTSTPISHGSSSAES